MNNIYAIFIKPFVFVLFAAVPTLSFSDDNVLPRLTLLTENYGDFNYSLQGREFEHKESFIGGRSTDFIKELMARTDISYRMKLRTWAVSYRRALNRPNYGVFSASRTEARENLFKWIGPIGQYEIALFARADSDVRINSIEDVRTLTVGGYNGSAATNLLEQQGVIVSKLRNDSLNPKRLHDDLIDVWVASDANAFALANETGYPDIKKVFVLKTSELYLAMNPNSDPDILTALESAYRQIARETIISQNE